MPRRRPARTRPDPSDELTAQQYAAIGALLSGETHEVAARTAGVDPRTLYRWRHENPAFLTEYQRRASEVADAVTRQLLATGPKAVRALSRMLDESDPEDDERVPHAVQVAAAREVLSRIVAERTAVEHAGSVQVAADDKLAAAFRALGTLSPDERAKLKDGA